MTQIFHSRDILCVSYLLLIGYGRLFRGAFGSGCRCLFLGRFFLWLLGFLLCALLLLLATLLRTFRGWLRLCLVLGCLVVLWIKDQRRGRWIYVSIIIIHKYIECIGVHSYQPHNIQRSKSCQQHRDQRIYLFVS